MSTSKHASLIELAQAPSLRLVPRWDDSFGGDAADFATAFGLKADPWQRLVLDDWMARRAGRWACLTAGLSVPRQNGKNAIIEIRELFGMVLLGEKFLHTAHEVKTARKAFKRLRYFFGDQVKDPNAKFPELNALVVEVRSVNGQEAVFLSNGGSVEFVARSKGSGRGFTVDVLVCDEAQHLTDEELEALQPVVSAAPLGNPQIVFTGTPPGPKVSGEVFTRVRSAALVRVKRECWHEWSVSGAGADMHDRRELHAANPALGIRLQMAVVNAERRNMSPEGLLRERGGLWAESHVKGGVITSIQWNACLDAEAAITAEPVLVLDASPLLTTAGIVAAGATEDGRIGLEVTSNGTVLDYREGIEWLFTLPWSGRAVWLIEGSAAMALQARLEQAGARVDVMPRTDYARSCVNFVSGVTGGSIAHRGQSDLTKQVPRGVARSADEGLWTWGRVKSSEDICLLVAATAAAELSRTVSVYNSRGLLFL